MAEVERDTKEEEIVPVLDEEEEQSNSPPESKDEDLPEKDDDDDDDESDDDEEETRLGAGEPDADEAEKARRRKSAKSRSQRQREARERDAREMKFLRSRNEDLERRFSAVESRVVSTEVSAIDQRINHLKGQIKLADQVIAKAVTAGQGEDLVEAQGIRDDLRDALQELTYAKSTITERGETEQQSSTGETTSRVSPTLKSYADQFVSKHSWWTLVKETRIH